MFDSFLYFCIASFKNLRKGDCVVCFSRRDVFFVKRLIEIETSMKCAIIYGALPMESRTHQARLFNDLTSGYDILVATDAIGMGLNLNIGRVVFYKIKKPTKLSDGTLKILALPKGSIKQIAGNFLLYFSFLFNVYI